MSNKKQGLNLDNMLYQLSPSKLHGITLQKGMGKETSSGALAINTGEFTGRSPQDRFIVKDEITAERFSGINDSFITIGA